MTPLPVSERALRLAVHVGLALLLLTPLIWIPETYFPFAVGKGLYARSLIAVVLVLWTVLALAQPRWRPPPTALLAVLAAGFLVAGLAAWFGVSPQRSLWTTYTRMEGLVEAAHWFAFFVVLAGVVRTSDEWARLLNVNLAVGLAVAAVAVVRAFAPDVPIPGLPPEARYPRISGTTGNPTFLGAYMQIIALLAAGFLVRSLFAPATDEDGRRKETRARRTSGDARPQTRTDEWPARLFWIATALCAVAALAVTGSIGALTGLAAGMGAAATLYAWLGPSRRARRYALWAIGGLGALAIALAVMLAVRAAAPADGSHRAFDSVLIERVTSVDRISATLGRRLRNWEAGVQAFAERPLTGWGPGNYFVALARHVSKPEGLQLVRDHAHNMLIEEAVTKGTPGLAAYLALWGLTFVVLVRAARRGGARDQALIIFAGAALTGWFVQSQSLFYSHSTWLQHMLLLGFAAHWETTMRGEARPAGAGLRAVVTPLRHPVVRAAIGAGVVMAAGASLATSHAIYSGAEALYGADRPGQFLTNMKRAIDAFEPMANGPRVILFNNVAANWPILSTHHPEEAQRLLTWTGAEAAAALAAEPESWVVHHALARLYRVVATTKPGYDDLAERHFARSLALAPNFDPLATPILSVRAP